MIIDVFQIAEAKLNEGMMAKVQDYDLEVSEFELQSRYYLYLRNITLGKGMNPLDPLIYGLNSITAILLQR